MEQEDLGYVGCAWNLFWVIVFIVSMPLAFWAFSASNDSFPVKVLSVFGVITGSAATLYQVYMRKPNGFLRVIKHELFITQKAIRGSAIWLDNRNKIEHEQTRAVIATTRSISYGLELLKKSHWTFISRQKQFICVDDASWNIVQKYQTRRTFHEPWVDNMYRPDKKIEVLRVVLRHNKTEIQDILFLEMDGARYAMPIPKKDGPDIYYYCENSFEHLMFNIVRQIYGMSDELEDLAEQAQIEWRQC
jgi:hypothetical protein